MRWIRVQEAALQVQRAVAALVRSHDTLHRAGLPTDEWRACAREHTDAYAGVLASYRTLEHELKGDNDDEIPF